MTYSSNTWLFYKQSVSSHHSYSYTIVCHSVHIDTMYISCTYTMCAWLHVQVHIAACAVYTVLLAIATMYTVIHGSTQCHYTHTVCTVSLYIATCTQCHQSYNVHSVTIPDIFMRYKCFLILWETFCLNASMHLHVSGNG